MILSYRKPQVTILISETTVDIRDGGQAAGGYMQVGMSGDRRGEFMRVTHEGFVVGCQSLDVVSWCDANKFYT